MSYEKLLNRRSAIKSLIFAVTGFTLLRNSFFTSEAKATSCPAEPPAGKNVQKVGEGMGKTQEYVTDTASLKHAKYKTGDSCSNCKHYKKDKEEGGYAPCIMMANKYVTSCGWCKVYLAAK